ncbi:hypothetical protein EG329_007973 [Mollisiaceae sp. DMI_Dod_QoI]|nr:hypothetical protein EG329_007973 [Helotiales sp. DMI_Dod_QoI]
MSRSANHFPHTPQTLSCSSKLQVILTNEFQCDESRPNCINCTTAKLACSYTTKTPDHGTFISYDNSPKSSLSPQNSVSTSSTQEPPLSSGPPVNFLHLELFNHFAVSEKAVIIFDKISSAHRPRVIKYAFSQPFLMYELLACSSMHLSLTEADHSKCRIYRDEASRLQAEALSTFNATVKEITDENLIPAFLFSGVLGLHSLADVFSMPDKDPDAFLDRLVHSMRILRGIHSILEGNWEMIINSEIAPLLQPTDTSNAGTDEVVVGFEEFAKKIGSLEGVEEDLTQVCEGAAKQLIWVYTSQLGPKSPDGEANPRMVTTWPITASGEYTELLAKRSPEALVVLAYFAVLLHRCRNLWALGDAGRILLNAVIDYLPSEWESWLIWPRIMVYGGTGG